MDAPPPIVMHTRLSSSPRTKEALERMLAHIERLAAEERVAGERLRDYRVAADELQARFANLDRELRQLADESARRLLQTGVLDMTAVRRVNDLRGTLELELQVRVRAAEIARQRFDSAQAETNAARALSWSARVAAAPKVIG